MSESVRAGSEPAPTTKSEINILNTGKEMYINKQNYDTTLTGLIPTEDDIKTAIAAKCPAGDLSKINFPAFIAQYTMNVAASFGNSLKAMEDTVAWVCPKISATGTAPAGVVVEAVSKLTNLIGPSVPAGTPAPPPSAAVQQTAGLVTPMNLLVVGVVVIGGFFLVKHFI